MSVVGSLEDLSFPDILQVVHLSRQSGTLILSGPGGERRVRFRNGLICDASLGSAGPRLDQVLVQRGLVAPAALEPARQRQKETGESLASALVALGALSQTTLDRLVREELRAVLRALVILQEGEFRFEVDDDSPAPQPEDELAEGLSPDAILSDLSDLPLTPRRWPPNPPPMQGGVPRRILLVSERSFLTLSLREELQRVGFEAAAVGTAAEGVAAARGYVERHESFLLICDLVLPDAAGVAWSGGIDLLREVRQLVPDLVALAIGDLHHASAQESAVAAGASGYLTLPEMSLVPFSDVGIKVREFCQQLCGALCLSDARGHIDWSAGARTVRVADPLSLLRGLVGELLAESGTDVSLLVLRLASEYFERGALFAVQSDRAVCHGAFGEPLDARMRGSEIPLTEGSLLRRAVVSRQTCLGPVPDDEANRRLTERLGPPAAGQAAFLPVLSGQEVFGVLYGDNAASGAAMPDLKALEIFLGQAGLAIQNALLRRRIETLTAQDGAHWRTRATA